MINQEVFRKAMGIFVTGKSFIVATLSHIYRMENILKPKQWMEKTFSHCYLPRTGHLTGVLDAHDVGLESDGNILFVNTRFNCIARVSNTDSFQTVWKPDFISKIVPKDHCHLNGMAMVGGKAKYVTAVSTSDEPDGWRDDRVDGGVIINVQTNEVICEGLSMPHSPRFHDGKLWVLNSGTGELGSVDIDDKTGKGMFNPLTFCPGFTRGLTFHGKYAFVGLSKPRHKRFEGLELDKKLEDANEEPWCGIQIIDLDTGKCVEWFRIEGDINELYDVAVLEGVYCAKSLGPRSKEVKTVISIEGPT